jgi:HPt (histidine-containing phosphotransfer) domain-containing protein
MSENSLIDPLAIQNLRDLGDQEFLAEIIGIFHEDTPRRIAELHAAFAAADVKSFVRAAHSIRGSANNLGAETLRQLASNLENDAKAGDLTGLDARITALETTFAATRDELTKLL